MIIAKVIGSAVASVKLDALQSSKLLVVSPADAQGDVTGAPVPGRGPGRRRRGRTGDGQPGQLGPHGGRGNDRSPVGCGDHRHSGLPAVLTGMLLSGRNRRMATHRHRRGDAEMKGSTPGTGPGHDRDQGVGGLHRGGRRHGEGCQREAAEPTGHRRRLHDRHGARRRGRGAHGAGSRRPGRPAHRARSCRCAFCPARTSISRRSCPRRGVST